MHGVGIVYSGNLPL